MIYTKARWCSAAFRSISLPTARDQDRPHITHYRARYFQPDKRNGQVVFSYKPLPGAEEAIYEKISDITIFSVVYREHTLVLAVDGTIRHLGELISQSRRISGIHLLAAEGNGERITARLRKLHIPFSLLDTSESIARWNRGELPVALIHPK